MRRGWLGLIVLAGGCDALFHLDPIATTDSSIDSSAAPVLVYIAAGDYDGDGKPNNVDPCPLVAGPGGDLDTDHDGVGDACDPDLNAGAPDCLVLFDSFTTGTIDPRWKDWSNTGDHFVVCNDITPATYCSPRPSAISALFFVAELEVGRVDAGFKVQALGGNVLDRVGISSTMLPQPVDVSGRMCGVGRPSGAAAEIDDLDGGALAGMHAVLANLAFNNGVDFRISWTPGKGPCSVNDGLITAVASVTTSQPFGSYVGIRNAHVDIDLRWMLAYGSRCPPR